MTGKTHHRTSRAIAFSLALIVVWSLGISITGCSTERQVENLIQKLGKDTSAERHKAGKGLVEIGEPAVEALIVALDDSDPFVRAGAAEALGQIGDVRAVEPLVAALNDPKPTVRESAAMALGWIGDPRAVGPLFSAFEKALDDRDTVGVAILEALEALDGTRATEAAVLGLGTNLRKIRKASQKILADAGPQAAAALVNGLSNPNEQVRTASVQLLEGMDEEAIVDVVIESLSNPDERVRTASVQLLEGMSVEAGEAAADTLVASLHGEDQDVAVAAMAALGAILEGKHSDAVLNILVEIVDPLIAFLEHQDGQIRAGAAWLLARTEDPLAMDALYNVRHDQDHAVRWAVLWALVEQGDSRAGDALIDELSGHTTDPLQGYAADALTSMGTKVLSPLIVALQSSDQQRSFQIIRILGEIGDAEAVPALVALLDDESDILRRSAVIALGKIGDTTCLEPLIESLQDGTAEVRQAAAESLNRMDDSTLAPLLSALKSKDMKMVAETYLFFIVRGEAGSEDLLIKTLSKYGTKQMALDYLNSHHTPLEEAGKTWAEEHGYAIFSVPGGGTGSGQWGGDQ